MRTLIITEHMNFLDWDNPKINRKFLIPREYESTFEESDLNISIPTLKEESQN